MEGFQKIVLFGAIIILIIALVFIGVALSYSQDNQQWPPMTPECPDYWSIDGSGNNATCINIKDLGTCPPQSGDAHLKMDFNVPAFTGSNELCAKYNWATKCAVSWDGITYGVNNPCQTTSTS
jgi:hypothetical protein